MNKRLCVVFSEVQAGVHVTWLDNFSKFYAIAVQGLAGAAAECLWTAHGLHRYVGPPVSTALIPTVRGMPAELKQKMGWRSGRRRLFLLQNQRVPQVQRETSAAEA